MKLIPADNYDHMSRLAAERIVQSVSKQKKVTLGLATGGTPIGTYQHLVEDHRHNFTSYQHAITFNLDEYIGLSPSHPNSYHHYMAVHLFDHIDISKEKIYLPDGNADDLEEECRQYEQTITAHGGIDLQLLGLGSNGHIGFNEPGTPFETPTHVIKLADATREANARFFENKQEVPSQAITMGLETIMHSREILLLVSGKRKKEALSRLLSGDLDIFFPASILNKHANVTVIADEEALASTDVKAFSGSINE